MKKIELSSYINDIHFKLTIEPENAFAYSEEKDLYCWSINIFFSANDKKIKNFYIPIQFSDVELDEINTKLLLNYISEKDYINILKGYLYRVDEFDGKIYENELKIDILNILEIDFEFYGDLELIFNNIRFNPIQDFTQFHIKPIPINDLILVKYLIHKTQEWKINYTYVYEEFINRLNSKNIDNRLKENSIKVNSKKILDEANNKILEYKENFLEYNCHFNLIDLKSISYENFYSDLKKRYETFKDFYNIFKLFKCIYDFSAKISNFNKVF